jgi:tRNA-(ms[2]io[6]A)-hydroxylase
MAQRLPMLCLRSRTESDWLARAIAHTAEVLIDHAHCERKAATQALSLLARFPDKPELTAPLLALAREELEHFELVLQILAQRGIAVVAQKPSGYQAQLFSHVQRWNLVDHLLAGGLIEARSCERFLLLSEHHPDAELRTAFRGLLESEARHHAMFVRLAELQAPREQVRTRLDYLAECERAIIEQMPPVARIHA